MTPLKIRRIVSILFFLPMIAIAIRCEAQRDYDYLPDYVGNWKTNSVMEERLTPFKLAPGERKLLLQKADTASLMIKNFAGFNPPKGMQMAAITRMAYLTDDEKAAMKPSTPLPLELRIEMADYIKYQGKIKVFPDPETFANITLFFNSTTELFNGYQLFSERLFDKHGDQLYTEPAVSKTFDNAVVYGNGIMLFAQPGKQLWIPVTAKEYLEALMDHYDKLIKDGHTDNKMLYDAAKKELDDLPQEDRAKAAYFNSQFEDNLSQLSLIKTPGTTAIVRFNPAYFNPSKPRTAVQLLVIKLGFFAYVYDEPILQISDRYSNNQVQLYNFFSHFDFSVFRRLFD